MLSRGISESVDVTHPGLSDMSRDMEGAGQERRAPVTRVGLVTVSVNRISSIVRTSTVGLRIQARPHRSQTKTQV